MALYISSSLSTFTDEGLKAVRALVKQDNTPIGWADFGKESNIFLISSSTTLCALMSA
jgi:hypothetical protein